MSSLPDTLRSWLREQILCVLSRKVSPAPFILWCDPERVWKDLLIAAAEGDAFDLWADDVHELVIRERFYRTPSAPRVVWLPVAKDQIGYFKVFELQAAEVREWTLAQAMAEYGVEIPSDQMVELAPLLASHMKEWIDRPKSAWKELTVGTAEGTLVDDERVLEILATPGMSFERLVVENRFSVFCRRIAEDFGLPAPEQDDANGWRRRAVASLICTDAAVKCPDNAPAEQDRIIPPGAAREKSLKLLSTWVKRIDLLDHFETLAPAADSLTILQYWAKNLPTLPKPLYSPTAERILFQSEVDKLARIEAVEALEQHLETLERACREHAKGFWGSQAKAKIPWSHLTELISIASILRQQAGVEQTWKSPADAVEWFTSTGWTADRAGEKLFQEDLDMTKGLGGLISIRVKLRKAYLRHLDCVNTAFSELLAHGGMSSFSLPHAGEVLDAMVAKCSSRQPLAVLVLDACRYDLGCRIVEALNAGETVPRARISAACAPLPSITALGMAACLPGTTKQLKVCWDPQCPIGWRVSAGESAGNLALAEGRREWLKRTLKLKDRAILSIADILNPPESEDVTPKSTGKTVFVFGDELDDEGHDGRLRLTGTEDHLDRYTQAIRRLRDAGYSTVMVVTDHGFFHWDPAPDERVFPKPEGDILWLSRRAIVGWDLKTTVGLKLPVTESDMDCCVPRGLASFKTYGGLGFFHGGASLQELVIPVVIAEWPKKAKKVGVVLKPLAQITSLSQRVEVASAAEANLLGSVDENLLTRKIIVKVVDSDSGKVLFKSQSISMEPDARTKTVQLEKMGGAEAGIGAQVVLMVTDADDEEVLDRHNVILKVELNEWD